MFDLVLDHDDTGATLAKRFKTSIARLTSRRKLRALAKHVDYHEVSESEEESEEET